MTLFRATVPAMALLLACSGGVAAQVEQGRLQVTPYAGFFQADNSSALKDAAMVGIEAVHYFTPIVGIGLIGNFARAESDGSFFPAMRWDVGPDTSFLLHVGQDLTVVTYGVVAKANFRAGRLAPYAAGGITGWTIFLDPQSNDSPQDVGGFGFELGGGVHFALSERAGIRFDVRDMIFTDFNRDDLNPVDPRFQTDVFLVPEPPPAKSTIHNIRATLGFTYVPAR